MKKNSVFKINFTREKEERKLRNVYAERAFDKKYAESSEKSRNAERVGSKNIMNKKVFENSLNSS